MTTPTPLPCGCVPHVTRMSPWGTALYCETEGHPYCNFECPHVEEAIEEIIHLANPSQRWPADKGDSHGELACPHCGKADTFTLKVEVSAVVDKNGLMDLDYSTAEWPGERWAQCSACGANTRWEMLALDFGVQPDGNFRMQAVCDYLGLLGIQSYVEMTGGGCATIYAGQDYLGEDDCRRWTTLGGPGTFRGDGTSGASFEEFYIGAENGIGAFDTASLGVTTCRQVAALIALHEWRVNDADTIEKLGLDPSLRGITNPKGA